MAKGGGKREEGYGICRRPPTCASRCVPDGAPVNSNTSLKVPRVHGWSGLVHNCPGHLWVSAHSYFQCQSGALTQKWKTLNPRHLVTVVTSSVRSFRGHDSFVVACKMDLMMANRSKRVTPRTSRSKEEWLWRLTIAATSSNINTSTHLCF